MGILIVILRVIEKGQIMITSTITMTKGGQAAIMHPLPTFIVCTQTTWNAVTYSLRAL